MYRGELVKQLEWPNCDRSEGFFTKACREAGYRFAYLGTLEDEPKVEHIGLDRMNGSGY